MRQSTTLLQLQTLQTCLFSSVQWNMSQWVSHLPTGGHMTMACLSGKGHGKNTFFIKVTIEIYLSCITIRIWASWLFLTMHIGVTYYIVATTIFQSHLKIPEDALWGFRDNSSHKYWCFTLYQTMPTFYHFGAYDSGKYCGKVTSNVSISHNLFYSIRRFLSNFDTFWNVVCKLSNWDSQKYSVW